jgi:hypothetical protein
MDNTHTHTQTSCYYYVRLDKCCFASLAPSRRNLVPLPGTGTWFQKKSWVAVPVTGTTQQSTQKKMSNTGYGLLVLWLRKKKKTSGLHYKKQQSTSKKDNDFQKKPECYAKKDEKALRHPENCGRHTDRQTDRQTDRHTDRGRTFIMLEIVVLLPAYVTMKSICV